MNRPDQLNALTGLMQAEIRHALDQSERNPEVIGTVLTGAGRGFCAGVDMNDLSDMSDAGERTGSSNDELKVDPGNPDNDPNYKSSPTYFLGLRKPLRLPSPRRQVSDSATQPFAICVLWNEKPRSLHPLVQGG